MAARLVSAAVARQASTSHARYFSTSTLLRKDYVQELYLKSLQNYQPPPTSKDDQSNAVREFREPEVPKAPAYLSGTDVEKELSTYEQSVPDMAPSDPAERALYGMTPKERYDFFAAPEKDGMYYGDRGLHSYNEWQAHQTHTNPEDASPSGQVGQPSSH